MRTRVVVRGVQNEEGFKLVEYLAPRLAEALSWIAERVVQGAGSDAAIQVEEVR